MTSDAIDQELFSAARSGDAARIATLLNGYPGKLGIRDEPYGQTLLHVAAFAGDLAVVKLLIDKGADVNARDTGDNSLAMHWAAAAGHPDVVRLLADAGGDVVGAGDDHELEVVGWASCWSGCDDDAHRAIVELLLGRGARHHIFSAIAMNLGKEVRRIAAADRAALSRSMSHNENFQRPLHFAVRMNRPEMVILLIELGADPLAEDGSGFTAPAYATNPEVDRALIEAIRARAENDLFTALALRELGTATRIIHERPGVIEAGGVLHLMAKRNDIAAVRWLLDHGADPNALWAHWDAKVTPLHLATLGGHTEVARLLLGAGADPHIRDSKHDSDAIGWATFFRHPEFASMLESSGIPPS